ncbi:hypothetical protein WJX84_008039 [Apatococcus fuscideae]|uniref:RanBD1 domain-containing protein n=1 Tax=Apatococcus fuscideae TaxID=2026836 RepID=A0AAW1TEC6_9CHLO
MSKRPTDDLEPSAKRGKRGSNRQITKDDQSDEEDDTPVVAGTFARASEDELKGRKIIKARRGPKTDTNSSNPFAGVNLTSATTNPFGGVSLASPQPNVISTPQAESKPTEIPAAGSGAQEESPAKQQSALDRNELAPEAASASAEPPEAAAGPITATPASTPVKPAAPTQSFSTFANTTASAFAVTASSASGFAFGNASAPAGTAASSSHAAGGNDGSAASQPRTSIFESGSSFSFNTLPTNNTSSFPSMQSIFGTSSAAEAPPVFGTSSASTKPAVELSEADTKNGEEDESNKFHGDGKLYQFVDQQWRERGSGDLRLNVAASGQARLVMRQRGNLKLLLNANLFPEMTHDIMDGGKGAMFQAINYCVGPPSSFPTDLGVRQHTQKGSGQSGASLPQSLCTFPQGHCARTPSCTLSLGDHVVLRDISEEIYISQRFQDGIVLGCQSKDGGSYSMLDTNLGQLNCQRFLAAARCKLWWMTPEWGTRAAHMPPETQFLLLELPRNCYAIILPLIDGNVYRSTLRPPRWAV